MYDTKQLEIDFLTDVKLKEQGPLNYLSKLRAIVLASKQLVLLDYLLVNTYIVGTFRGSPNAFSLSEWATDSIESNSNDRFIEKWDTSASTISQNTYSRFRQALLPDGLDSFAVEVEGANSPEVNEYFTKLLRNSWSDDSLSEIDLAVGDFMNYGTAFMTCLGRHLDVNRVWFYELLNPKGEYSRCFVISSTNNYYMNSINTQNQNINSYNSFLLTELREPLIIKIESGFADQIMALRDAGMAKDFASIEYSDMVEGVFYENLKSDNSDDNGLYKVYQQDYKYEEIFVARMGTRKNGYGTGCGVNALGAIIDANYVLGSRYTNLQRITNPNYTALAGCTIKKENGKPGIDLRPNAITFVSSPTGAPMGLDQMIRKDDQSSLEMNAFLPYRELFYKELDAAYNAFLFKPFEPVPSNVTATGAILQLEDTINAYRAKADSFMECVLIPLAKFKLKNEIEKKICEINFLRENGAEQVTTNDNMELMAILETIGGMGIDIRGKNTFNIKIKDLAYSRRRQAKALEIQEQLNLSSMAMQFAEADQDLAQQMLAKIKDLYK